MTSSTTSSYAGSATSIDNTAPNTHVADRLSSALDPGLLDSVIAVQAQTSGRLNALSLETSQLHAEAESRLAELRQTFADGAVLVRRVRRDLDYVEKKLRSVVGIAEVKHPIEYVAAVEKVV